MDNDRKLRDVFAGLFNVNPNELNDESSQDTIEAWDSLGMVNLVVELEQAFYVQFDLLEIADFKNFGIVKSILTEKGIQFE